jgi:hypothetical protein
MQAVSGRVVLRLERDADLNLHFFHSSPGTGTRVATANLNPLKGSTTLTMYLVWSPKETRLHVVDANNPAKSVMGIGKPSERTFRVGADGDVYQVGDEGVEVMEVTVYSKGQPTLQPTALESWKETIRAVKILLGGTSPDGYNFEIVSTNMVIVMLVTGLETYCKRRFLELEEEGIKANYDSLANEFFSVTERDRGEPNAILQQVMDEGISPIIKLINKRKIDFGNYEDCKKAYNKGYGIKFGEDLGVSNVILEEVQHLISYRHRIVHVSPFISMLNIEEVPPKEPVFPNRQYAEKAMNTINEFVQKLHQATLRLRS